ncbi:MAG: efflux RND transporter periplasmic adaptor subunit [Candidatus Egerieousia sp.]
MKDNKKKVKRFVWIGAAILLVIVLSLVKKSRSNASVSVEVNKVGRTTIVETIPANGKIQPVTEVKISPDVSGEIIELNVKEGDIVKKGDLIIKIKQDIYISAVEQATANLNSTRAAYNQQEAQCKKTEQNYLRNKKLYEMRTISLSEYETACADWEVAKQQLSAAKFNISSARAHLKEANENLLKTTIYAPMDGIVSKLSVEKGERVVGTSQMAGTEMLRIADFSQMEVLVDVNENDIIRLGNGDSAKITVDAYQERKFDGVVTEVANSSKSATATSADAATSFEVKVRVLNSSYEDLTKENATPFRPGMSASVTIQTTRIENVLTVPLSSITTRKDLNSSQSSETKQFVFVYNKQEQTVEPVEIRTGIQDMSNIQVISGLSDSTMIVTAPFSAISKTLKSGSKVKTSKSNG